MCCTAVTNAAALEDGRRYRAVRPFVHCFWESSLACRRADSNDVTITTGDCTRGEASGLIVVNSTHASMRMEIELVVALFIMAVAMLVMAMAMLVIAIAVFQICVKCPGVYSDAFSDNQIRSHLRCSPCSSSCTNTARKILKNKQWPSTVANTKNKTDSSPNAAMWTVTVCLKSSVTTSCVIDE